MIRRHLRSGFPSAHGINTGDKILIGYASLLAVLFAGDFLLRPVVPGWSFLRAAWLLKANLNSDLREGFVWFDKLPKGVELGFMERCSIQHTEDGLARWNSPVGSFWLPPEEDAYSLADMAAVFRENTYSYKGRSVRAGDVVVDCGAHVGAFTTQALSLGARLVLAIEPSTGKAACLRKQFSQEIATGKVRVLQIGVWSKADKLWLDGPSNPANSVVPWVQVGEPSGPRQGEWIRVDTLDRMLTAQGIDKVDFLKMDIEGAETEALRGARETIRKFRPFLAIATEHTDDIAQNVRNVIRVVSEVGVPYKIGFGRYGQRGIHAYAPMEVFFVPPNAER